MTRVYIIVGVMAVIAVYLQHQVNKLDEQ